MSTSNLSQTAPLVVAPSLTPSHSLVTGALHRVKTLLMHALVKQELSERTYQPSPFLVTPVRFSKKDIYTPLRDWNGYR
jgi:hypothetical protein